MIFKQLVLCLAICASFNANIISPSTSTLSPLTDCTSTKSGCCDSNTISVHGSATIQATPDQALLQASITVNGDTAASAIKKLTTSVNSVIAVLTANGLKSDNYVTSSFNLYPNTSYNNGVSTVVGQIATQSFQITIPSIAKDGSNIGKLIDSLATVNGIILNGLSFDIYNKTAVYQQARQQAYQNAQTKAQDYGAALILGVGQALNVVDSFSNAPVASKNNGPLFLASVASNSAPTVVNVGTVSISYDLDVIFGFAWSNYPILIWTP